MREFAGTASHQLRTPLTALRLRLEQLSAEMNESDPSRSTLDSALVETDRLHRMIEGLLALSRAEDAAAVPVLVDLSAIAHERGSHWRPLGAESDVSIDVLVPNGIRVSAIPGALEQILDNLIDNALEVSPPGSRLTIEVHESPSEAELHVIDAGPGMSEHDRDAAFERFWRADGAVAGGTGLGLAIVRQLVTASGVVANSVPFRRAGSTPW